MKFLMGLLLRVFAASFNYRPSFRKYLRSSDGWINFTIGFRSMDGNIARALRFHNGRVRVLRGVPEDADVSLISVREKILHEMLRATQNELLNYILKNRMIINGNIAYLQLFNYYVSLLTGRTHLRMLKREQKREKEFIRLKYGHPGEMETEDISARGRERLKGRKVEPGVKYLDDPYLPGYGLDDFPRLRLMLDRHFNEKPQICAERPRLLTEWFRREGFETDSSGSPRVPELRQALAFKYLMANREPLISPDDLLAGTSTSKLPTGVIIYPDAQGTMIWGELNSVENRALNPYRISPEDAATLHDVFSFWANRNFREWVRKAYQNPLCQQIEERWVCYFVWKSVGISHTVPDFPRVLQKGIDGIIADIDTKIDPGNGNSKEECYAPEAMKICLEGVKTYARNLSERAEKMARGEKNPVRRKELGHLAAICRNVPAAPARTLDEAVNCIWIMWIALHMENTNTGLSPGRLDQWLQPYFETDLEKLQTPEERQEYIRHAVELTGCLFMRCTDHLPLVPDIGNYLFGGSSSDQAITLGGVTPDGKDAVNDMSYIFLKVTELLSIRDPNVNARFHPGINSDTYLKRLCEVNFTTAATPSMHNDAAVFRSLERHGYPPGHAKDWSATGCVEPTISGRHMGHTGSILFNLVSALEMALNNGRHPLMDWAPGPETGRVEEGAFHSFDSFFDAFAAQLKFLIENAVEFNRMLAEVHAQYRPTPLLSSLIDGAIEKGLDVTRGGALYNTSGTSNIGLADVTDSLAVIKKLVFDEQKISFAELKKALDSDFENNGVLHTRIRNKVPLFGSGSEETLEIANRVIALVQGIYASHTNYRGGRYTTGFWSMSQHVAYGNLSGALPSGRRAGKSFTPGLTPQPLASDSFLDNLRDVASLDPRCLDNNIAFNVKLVPSPADTREKTVETMASYVKTYFEQGGMQMQFNVVKADTLRDAMVNPENYRNLLVRISGYNAYFVTLNREMQIELIERAEYSL